MNQLGRSGRLLVLLAALAGLFAMHGLGDHGTMSGDTSMAPMTSMQGSGPGWQVGHHAGPALGAPGHGMAPMGAGCLALLALGLLLLTRVRRTRLGAVRAARTTTSAPLPSRAPRGPPSCAVLCVWRC